MKVCKIKDIGIIGTGTTPSMKNKEFYDSDDIMFIKPSDFIDNRITELSSSISYISNKSREKARIFPAGTVLCTCIGNIGKIAIVSKEASCNQQNNYIIPYKEFDSKYVAYSLLSQRKKMEFIGANAPIVPIINKTEFSNIEIPVYDSSTQIKIAHHLDTIQSAIDNKQQQLKELGELVKSRFIEMFSSQKDSFLFCTLDTVSSRIFAGGDRPKETSETKNDEFQYPVFANAETNKGLLCYSKTYQVELPCVTIAARGCTVGYTEVRNEKFTPVVRLLTIIPSKEIIPLFLKYYLDLEMKIEGNGAAQPQLTVPTVKRYQIYVPPLSLQNDFAFFVQQIDKSKFVSEQFMDLCYNII